LKKNRGFVVSTLDFPAEKGLLVRGEKPSTLSRTNGKFKKRAPEVISMTADPKRVVQRAGPMVPRERERRTISLGD